MKRLCFSLSSNGQSADLMPIPGSNDDGTTMADLAHFDLVREVAESEKGKPWPSGIHARTLFNGCSPLLN